MSYKNAMRDCEPYQVQGATIGSIHQSDVPISAPSVKGWSAHDYMLAKNDYDMIMKHINQ